MAATYTAWCTAPVAHRWQGQSTRPQRARRPNAFPRWTCSLTCARARLSLLCTVAGVIPASRAISPLVKPPKYASLIRRRSVSGSARIPSSTAWRTIAPENSFHVYGWSVRSPMPSSSIRFRPRCSPRSRRRSTGPRRTPVVSHARQESFVAPGSCWFSASGISQYTAVPKTPGGPEAPERGLRWPASPGA